MYTVISDTIRKIASSIPPNKLFEIKLQTNAIKTYLSKIEHGLNATGDVQIHLNELKRIFNELEGSSYVGTGISKTRG